MKKGQKITLLAFIPIWVTQIGLRGSDSWYVKQNNVPYIVYIITEYRIALICFYIDPACTEMQK